MLDDRSKMPVNKKGFIEAKNFPTCFCCLHIKVTFLKIPSQSIKFPRSYSFLKCLLWANNISREKEAIKKFLLFVNKLRPQLLLRNLGQSARAWIRLLQSSIFARSCYFQTTSRFEFRATFALGSIAVRSLFLLKLWKRKSDHKCSHAWSKTKPAGRRESSAPSTGPTTIDIERGWYNLTAMSSR